MGETAVTDLFHTSSRDRLLRLQAGALSPLWLPFLFAASIGAAAWMASRWMRGEFAATLPGAAAQPTAEAVPTPADLMAVGAIDASLPEAAPEAVTEPEPAAVLAEETPETSAEPVASLAPRVAEADLGEEPGGKAGLLAETSASAMLETEDPGGDVRAEEAAEVALPAAAVAQDDVSIIADAAYAANLGPVPAPSKTSRKRKSLPGTAPEA